MKSLGATSEEIAYVRQLAESGAHAPLLGGRFMAWWGLLLTIAYVAHHFALQGLIGDQRTIFAWIWLPLPVVGVIGHFILARGMAAKPGAGSAGNRAARTAWVTAACTLVSMVIGSALAAESGAAPATFDWVAPVAFAVYACALLVTGVLGKSSIAMTAGAGAVVMVGLFTALILSPDRYLLAAAGAALTVFLPGLFLLLAEPKGRG
jgi:uncharacterized membrane protein